MDRLLSKFSFGEESDELMEISLHFDPNFKKYLAEMYNTVRDDFTPEKLDKCGLRAISYIKKSRKISARISEDFSKRKMIQSALKAIIYRYGYGIAFNVALQEGIVFKRFISEIKKEAKKLNLTETELLSKLEAKTSKSLFIKRAEKAEKIIEKFNNDADFEKILKKIEQIMGEVHFLEWEESFKKLMHIIPKKYRTIFKKYITKFERDYSPHSSAFELLISSKQSVVQRKKEDKEFYTSQIKLLEIYQRIKFWTEATSVELHAAHMALYFNLFKKTSQKLNFAFNRPINEQVRFLKKEARRFKIKTINHS